MPKKLKGALHNPACRGLTVTELLGVLAVIGLLAVVLVPNVLKRMDRAAWTKELSDMGAISNALTLQILRSNTIPNETGWAGAVANWTIRPTSQVLTNNRRYARLFFYDQSGWLSNNLPYTQGQGGTGAGVPSSARIVLVSTIAKALPFTNGALSAVNFNTFWNAAQGTVPSFLTNLNWKGNGDDLVIQRVTVDPLFHHLILTTRDASGAAGFSINSAAVHSAVPSNAAGTNTYYFDGTTVGLWAGTNLSVRFVLTRDQSFTFESGVWSGQLTGSGGDGSGTAQSFAIQAATFASAGIPGGHQGAGTQGTLSSFFEFMYAYTLWANKCPHFQYIGNNVADWKILDQLGKNGSGGIINGATGSGGGGLLQ